MPIYQAPLDDIDFVLNHVLDLPEHLRGIGAADLVTVDDARAVIEAAAKMTESRIHPINMATAIEGCRFAEGRVTVPPAIKEAYRAYVDGGWSGLTCAPEHGGQGLPFAIGVPVQEIINSGGLSFGDYVGLFSMAYGLLRIHAEEPLRSRYLPGLADGSIGATMCMTEPHCGTDVGLLKTRAEPNEDGTFKLTGTKIFISAGDQDLTANILHLVLARIAGAPAGSRGVSLFAVPKYLPGANGAIGPRNAVLPTGLEHKMGYSASATCQMSFDGATGWLIGRPERGLAAMFDMINPARIAVAGQGLSMAEVAYQSAADYAKNRLQGRSLKGAVHPELAADPILVHPDVRRMLLGTRAFIESARGAYYWTGMLLDNAQHHENEDVRVESQQMLAFVTPILKATLSDYGFQACNDCMQIFGGHGYIRDHGMEQLIRDVRIAQIQEGANGMLATDVIRRQILKDSGVGFQRFLAEARRFIADHSTVEAARDILEGLGQTLDYLEDATSWLREAGQGDTDEVAAAGVEYQRILGHSLLGWMWARQAVAAAKAHESEPRRFFADKLRTARFFVERVMPMAVGHLAVMKRGGRTILEPDEAYF